MFFIVLGIVVGLLMLYTKRNIKSIIEDQHNAGNKEDIESNLFYVDMLEYFSIALIIAGIVIEILNVI